MGVLWRMNYKELSLYLASKGLSETGQKSITDNEITGQMLLEFCEEDIQDAFSVFKDRFTIRKALREQKSADSQTTPAVVSPTRLQTSTHQTHQVQSSTIHKPYEQQFSPPTKVGPVPNKHVISSHGAVYNQHHQQHNRQVISLVKEENSDIVPLQIHKNQAFVPPIHTVSSPVKKTENYEVKSSSKELMNERVSSTDEYRHARKSHGNADDNQRNIYDCAVDALVSLSNKHTSTEYLSKTNWSNVSVASQNSSTVQSTSTAHPGASTTHPGPISPSQLGGSNIYGLTMIVRMLGILCHKKSSRFQQMNCYQKGPVFRSQLKPRDWVGYLSEMLHILQVSGKMHLVCTKFRYHKEKNSINLSFL